MSPVFILCLALVMTVLWMGFTCAFVAYHFPRTRVYIQQMVIGSLTIAIAGLVLWGAA